MFAFAIWSEDARTLFLARDPFGIKPLYYHHDGHRFAFASELKTLVRILPIERRVAPAGLAALLTYLWIPPEFCILEGFASVPPGHFVILSIGGALHTECYWTLAEQSPPEASEEDWVERLDAIIDQSIERHLVADVEVAAFLS
jgi:asparagine synthase (glutamine-hydrolysing)